MSKTQQTQLSIQRIVLLIISMKNGDANVGGRSTGLSVNVLQAKVSAYMNAGHHVLIKEEPFVVAVASQIMPHADSLTASSEISFVDSTAACHVENNVLTFFLVPGVCGAVPLGVLIMSSTNMAIYTVSFALMKDAFGMQAFGTKGHPSVYLTDDCDAKRAALEDVAPASQLLLCHFHVSQAAWSWLCNDKHRIDRDNRKSLIGQFCTVMYSTTKDEATENYNVAVHSDELEAVKYSPYQSYLDNLWDRRQLWCLATDNSSLVQGQGAFTLQSLQRCGSGRFHCHRAGVVLSAPPA